MTLNVYIYDKTTDKKVDSYSVHVKQTSNSSSSSSHYYDDDDDYDDDDAYLEDIKLSDGDISFSKELYESSSIKIITGDKAFLDPLIINFAEDINPFDNIGSLKFAFDLDSNGDTEDRKSVV